MKYLLLLIPITVYAGGNHHENTVINHYQTSKYSVDGIALGLAASQLSFDGTSFKWQGSVGVGSYDGSSAVSIGIGKRVNDVLFTGSIGEEDGKAGFGAGASIKW